jgi:hypothetical protein
LSWLLAGAALADANPTWVANHFYDPQTGTGWQSHHPNGLDGLFAAVQSRLRGTIKLPRRGVPAPDWVTSPDNPFALRGFLDQYEKAMRSGTPGERNRHWAGALVATGAILHVLGDLSTPSHVRSDEAAHNAQVGFDAGDRGSRFERLAAIAWGRLGVPPATRRVSLPTWRAYFSGTDPDQPGLAPWVASRYFSVGTLPRPVDVGTTRRADLVVMLTRSLSRPAPAVPRRLNLMSANQPSGSTLRNDTGVCLARYRVTHGRLSWSLDDECQLEQAASILPVAVAYEAGLLRWLFRGDLRLAQSDGSGISVTVHGTPLGAGTLTLLGEDARGVRTAFHNLDVQSGRDGAVIATAAPPPGARRIAASFRGVDGAGEPIVGAGLLTLVP